jgi:hypothetical protein
MRGRKVMVRHVTEECQCGWCGWPFGVGDSYRLSEDGHAYCGGQCQLNHQCELSAEGGGA